jgi:hypothetical protein
MKKARNIEKTGSTKGRPIPELLNHERFLSKININQKNECWEWSGYLTSGYGNIRIGKENFLAHRFSFSLFNDIDISNSIIDHGCKNRSCVNPDHLRVVSQAFNVIENSQGIAARNTRKTHCLNGHELNEENTYKRKDRPARNCKQCSRNNFLKRKSKET